MSIYRWQARAIRSELVRLARRRLVRPLWATGWAALAVAGGAVFLNAAMMQPPRPPQPEPVAAAPTATATTPIAPAEEEPSTLDRAEPVRIHIPAISLKANLYPLGLEANNELAVPPFDKPDQAGWYQLGPTPGELGSAVIVGHVDSEKTGPAVFFNLGRLRAGDIVMVKRTDGGSARFTVDSVRSYLKSEFPTDLVYAGTDRATLKLVTCGGEFDKKTKNYLSNTVVFATYTP